MVEPSEIASDAPDFPRRYGLGKGWRWARLLIGLSLTALGIGRAYVGIEPALAGNETEFLMVGLGLLGALVASTQIFCAVTNQPRLTLFVDAIELRGLLSWQYLRRDEIRGYRIRNRTGRLYWVTLEPKDKSGHEISFSNLIVRDDVLDDWLASFPDLDHVPQQAMAAPSAIESAALDNRLEHRETTRLVVLALNLIAIALSLVVWADYDPHHLVVWALVLVPCAAVAVIAVRPRFYRQHASLKNHLLSLRISLYFPGCFLLIRAIHNKEVFDWYPPVLVGGAIAIAVTLAAALANRAGRRTAGAVVATLLLLFPYGYSTTLAINHAYDTTPPNYFPAAVQHVRQGDGEKLENLEAFLAAWENYDQPNRVDVPRPMAMLHGTHMAYCVQVKDGALGIAYRLVVWCPPDLSGSPMPRLSGQASLDDAIKAYRRGDYAAAESVIADAAAAGDMEATYLLGLLYWEGRGVQRNDTTAQHNLMRAAYDGHGGAMALLGYSHERGVGLPVNMEEALSWYRAAEKRDAPLALHNLGLLYQEGRGVPRDLATARDLWIRAVKQDYPPAMIRLALLYADGRSGRKDMSRAIHWWRRAARLGDREGAWMLARHLLGGPDNKESLVEGVRMMRQAAKAGVGEAAYTMSLLHREGRGVPKNSNEEARWLNAAVRLGHPIAAVQRGHVYRREQRNDDAFKMFHIAAVRDYPRGQALLGELYETGLGISANQERALSYYRRAAKQGDAVAQRQLGYAYQTGNGVPQDTAEALRLYRLAGFQGDAYAAHHLASIYFNGRGVSKNVAAGTRWARVAADQGHPGALNDLAFSHAKGLGGRRNVRAAIQLYRRAALYGQPNALHSLAAHYYAGRGVKRDYSEAYYFALLAEQFYQSPEDLEKIAKFKRNVSDKLLLANIDPGQVEIRAAAFEPRPQPYILPPPAKPLDFTYSIPPARHTSK